MEALASHHSIAAFSSEDAAIDAFLHSQALAEQTMGLSSVTVALEGSRSETVVGFFTLSPLSIKLDPRLLASLDLAKDAIKYPSVGGYLLGRLGVARSFQKQGIGSSLVAIAVQHARLGRAGAGGVFLAVDAQPNGSIPMEKLIDWYEKLGFKRLGESRRLVMRL